MGCDIHGTIEKLVDGRWELITRLDSDCPMAGRNYAAFAALAGVRGPGPEPEGFPEDASVCTRIFREQICSDGHSDSHLPLAEACKRAMPCFFYENNPYAKTHLVEYLFKLYDLDGNEEELKKYRFVFWFDN